MVLLVRFGFQVLYGQIFVHRPGEGGFPLWTDAHVAQGFAWRPPCIAFGIPDHDGESVVSVTLGAEPPPLAPDCTRAVEAPFAVPPAGIEVGGLAGSRVVAAPPGPCQLRFDLRPRGAGQGFLIGLAVMPGAARRFAILRRDGEMTADAVLETSAEEAR